MIILRKTLINNGIYLNEYKNGLLFGTDALLLAAFSYGSRYRIGCDLGSGSGVVSLLSLSSNYAKQMIAIEVQPKYAELTQQNFSENGFKENTEVVCCNVKDIKKHIVAGYCDFVMSNPPYLPTASGKLNLSEDKKVARHETLGNIDNFCDAASWCIRSGGSFYVVYRPERLAELIVAMDKAKIRPKRLRTVHPSPDAPPSLILCEGKKDASHGLIYESPLYIYTNKSHKTYTNEMTYITDTIKIQRQR